MRSEFRGSAPDAGKIPGVLGTQYVLNSVSMAVGVMEMVLYSIPFDYIPETNGVPLIVDMSSTILSRPIDVSKFAIIYAGAQKNIGPAGLAVVIIREDLLGKAAENTPAMFNYEIHASYGSMYNTPATYSWYMAGLVFEWIKERGASRPWARLINARPTSSMP